MRRLFNASSAWLLVGLVLHMQSCSLLRTVNEAKTFARCRFRLKSVSSIQLAGIDVQHVTSRYQLNPADAARLSFALANRSLPLTFRLHLEAQNPNASVVAISQMSWTLFIDQLELLSGELCERVEIAPSSSSIIPLDISMDLFQALSGESVEAIANFAFNLTTAGDKPTRMMLRIKPVFQILGSEFSYPIDVGLTLSDSNIMPR